MNCPFCHKSMTRVDGRQTAAMLANMLIAATSPMYNMVIGAISSQNGAAGSHCNSSDGCGYFALFIK